MKRPNKILFLGCCALIAGGSYWYWNAHRTPAVTYKEYKVQRGDLQVRIISTGTVSPENGLDIKAPVAGRAEKILVQEGQKVKKGQILLWVSSNERAALLDAAASNGAAEVKRWEEMYRPTPVLAPINGTIILRAIEPGQTFTATDAILTMSDRLTVKALVDETDIAAIKLKQRASIVLDAYPNLSLEARVDQIAYDAKTTNNVTTYTVDVLPDQTPEYMRSGMTANVSFVADSLTGALLVPTEGIKMQGGDNIVLIRGPDQKTIDRKIEIGISDGKRTEVKSGVDEGDVVLVEDLKIGAKSTATNPFSPSRRPKASGKSQ